MSNPADLFVTYWDVAKDWSGAVVHSVMLPPVTFGAQVDSALLIPDGQQSYDALVALVEAEGNGNPKAKKLIVLRKIDEFFSRVHPRIQFHAGLFRDIPVWHWIRKLKIQRQRTGAYVNLANKLLIPKGPLTRNIRPKYSTSAYVFADQFEFLTVVPSVLDANGRTIDVGLLCKSRAISNGVAIAPSANGEESIAFIPVAQLESHLQLHERHSNGCSFFDFSLTKCMVSPPFAIQSR